jgi:pSer/pThr/pTyr-binding forkhead associated (FHA) protein
VALFEYSSSRGRNLLGLEGDRISIGKSGEADLIISDPAVSRLHAAVERLGAAWCIRDLGSTNGTLVNGKPLSGERVLRDGDEVVVGKTRLIYRDRSGSDDTSTTRLTHPPALTPREYDVLVELCRPALSGSAFTPPASVRDIADVLVVTEAAVKQHLARLFDKFDIAEEGREPRRVRLANQALQSGAVALADLRRRALP